MNRNNIIIFSMVGVILFSAVATGLLFLSQDTTSDRSETTAAVDEEPKNDETTDQTICQAGDDVASVAGTPAGEWPFVTDAVDALQILDVREGEGDAAKLGDCITVHYRLALSDGTEVAGNNTFGGKPIAFDLVEGGLIAGWTEGIPGLKVGGLRRLIVPASLGYGDTDRPSIPAGSTLVFDVELVDIK